MNKDRSKPPELPKHSIKVEKRTFSENTVKASLETICSKCGKDIRISRYGEMGAMDSEDAVIVLPRAAGEFENMIYWGEEHPINKDEQLFQGMGFIFTNHGKRILVVTHFLYVYAADRTPVSAKIFNGRADNFLARLEYEREIFANNESRYNKTSDGYQYNPFNEKSELIIYGHTHPGIGAFISSTDRTSGIATPSFPAGIMIADPKRKEILAAVGTEMNEAQVYVCRYNDNVSSKTDNEGDAEKNPIALIEEIGRDCTLLINSNENVKGRYTSYTTLSGAKRLTMKVTCKPAKEPVKKKQVAAKAKRSVATRYSAI